MATKRPRKERAAAPSPKPLEPRTVQMPTLEVRGMFVPSSVNEEARTVEVVFGTEAPVERYDWMSDTRYLEVLSMVPEHVRLDRLNMGASVLDSHKAFSVKDVLGAVVPESVRVVKKQALAKIVFSDRAEVEPVWNDVKKGIVASVSFGYRVYKFEETVGKGNALPIRKAIDWEPFEVSMVPIPADAGARVRDGVREGETNTCVIATATRQEDEMAKINETPAETIAENDTLTPPVEERAEELEPNEADLGAERERTRITGIYEACRAARLPVAYADGLVKDPKITLLDAQTRIFRELAKRDAAPGVPSITARAIEVGEDPFVHVRAGIENALLAKSAPELFKLDERGKQYRGMTLLDVAKAYLHQQRVRTTDMSKMDLATVALGLRTPGMHTTSDFAHLMADLPGKILRAAYEAAPQTFGPIVRRMSLQDFKKARLLQLGEAPALLEVGEHGEFTHGTMGEAKEEVQLKTYGRVFAITRQALINDDTDAFSRVPMAFGSQARNKESDLVWEQITSNPTMGDSIALFDTAGHGNLASAGGAIDVTTIGTGRAAMRKQKGLDAATFLNVNPSFILVPVGKETIAETFVNPIQPNVATAVNPFAGKLTVISEPRLDVNSATAWYLAAGPSPAIDVIVLVTLEGESGPSVTTRIGFEVDGMEFKVRHDVAAKVVDYRGLYKNPGA